MLFKQIRKDMDTGPIGKINNWYEEMLKIVYTNEEIIESDINLRHGYNEEKYHK